MAIHTILVYYFTKYGGVESICQSFEWTVQFYFKLQEEKSKDQKNEDLEHIKTSLNAFTKLLRYLSNATHIEHSPLVSFMAANKPPDDNSFDISALIIKVQDPIMKFLIALWNHKLVKRLPSIIVSDLTVATGHLLDAQYLRMESFKQPDKSKKVDKFKPDQNLITQLMDMGFSRSHVEEALRAVRTSPLTLLILLGWK